MKRIRIPWQFGLALLVALAALPAGAAQPSEAVMTVSGVYAVTFRLQIASTLPASTTITCRARIVPGQSSLDLRQPQPSATQEETAAGVTAVTGPLANCTAEIPFAWTVNGHPRGVILSYEVDAVSNAGAAPLLLRSSAQQNIQVAFPAPGGSASLSFHVMF